MIAELSHFVLVLALVMAAVQSWAGLACLNASDAGVRAARAAAASRAAWLQFGLIATAFIGLTYSFVTSDFSLLVVTQNSHSAKPLIYKIAGVWGNHEGSLLLWVLVLAAFGAAVAGRPDRDRGDPPLRTVSVGVHGLLGIGFLILLIATSNPFARLLEAPVDGQDLNPLLQDPALALHPPLLYLGYVGFASAFAFAVAGLLIGKIDRDWARATGRPVLVAWSALTVGISLGSWWAYYELGWGGWWFWDPVENASLLPWLAGTALLHSIHVLAKRQAMASWTVLLAILTFSLSLLGTFLVRSGVLTSVHAFALDPDRGAAILVLIGVSVTGALALYGWRAGQAKAMPPNPEFAPVSREGALILNNLLLALSCAVVLLGTLYPLFLQILNLPPVSVGPPYFEATVVPIFAPLLLAIGVAPFLPWRQASLAPAMKRLRWAGLICLGLGAALVRPETFGGALAGLGLASGFWIIATSAIQWWDRAGQSLAKGWRLPAWQQGMTIAHLGVGVMVLGIAGSAVWSEEKILRLEPGQTVSLAGHNLVFDGASRADGPNYDADRGVLKGDGFSLEPEKRWYPVAQMRTTEAAIRFDGWGNLYATLGQPDEVNAPLEPGNTNAAAAWSLHLQYHPMIVLIWLGSFIMAFGGLIAAADRLFQHKAQPKTDAVTGASEAVT